MPTLDLSKVKGPSKLDTLPIVLQMPGLLNGQSGGPADGLLIISQNLDLFSGEPGISLENRSKAFSDKAMPSQERKASKITTYRTNFFIILPPSRSI
jgi:hypothetical protein